MCPASLRPASPPVNGMACSRVCYFAGETETRSGAHMRTHRNAIEDGEDALVGASRRHELPKQARQASKRASNGERVQEERRQNSAGQLAVDDERASIEDDCCGRDMGHKHYHHGCNGAAASGRTDDESQGDHAGQTPSEASVG